MKQLLDTPPYSQQTPKAWASLDCLLTSLPITPLSRSTLIMRSSGNLSMTDPRRISPQTTSSSGYHSDLSSATSANESPQSVHEILPVHFEKPSSSSSQTLRKTLTITSNATYEKPLANKNLSRLSSFIRKQYERAKTKLTTSKSLSSSTYAPTSTVTTCSKATSTTPISHLSEENYTITSKQTSISNQKPHYLSSVYKQNSYTEPVYSVYVQPLSTNPMKKTTPSQHKNYTSIHECYSHQPSYRYPASDNTAQYSSSSYRRLATMANFGNSYHQQRRHQYYPVEMSSSCQSYYPYRYTSKNYDYNRSNYLSLNEVVSSKTSAFKPIGQQQTKPKGFHPRPSYNLYEQVPLSDDPCDLEVAQYFPQTSQWSNPNYFDIYSQDADAQKQTYAETLC